MKTLQKCLKPSFMVLYKETGYLQPRDKGLNSNMIKHLHFWVMRQWGILYPTFSFLCQPQHEITHCLTAQTYMSSEHNDDGSRKVLWNNGKPAHHNTVSPYCCPLLGEKRYSLDKFADLPSTDPYKMKKMLQEVGLSNRTTICPNWIILWR